MAVKVHHPRFADNPIMAICDEPNLNMFPLERVENHLDQAVVHLNGIAPADDWQRQLIEQCLAVLRELQQTNLLKLRRAIEST